MLSLIDPFTVLLALVPLIGYMAIVSCIRVSGRVLVTTVGRDIAALGIAIAGMLAVGPAALFFPQTAATVFGPVVWLALAVFYALVLALVALTSKAGLVVFGRTPDEVYPALLRAALRIDSGTEGDSESLKLHLPTLGIRLRVEGQRGVDHAKVIAFEPIGSPRFWRDLLGNLRHEIHQDSVPVPRRGIAMLVTVVALSGLLLWQGFGNQGLVVEGFRDWLWR